jgi:hypothetical protein
MKDIDLLSIVQPPDGWFAIIGIKGAGADLKRQQHLVETREEVSTIAARLVRGKWNVFFGVAKYTDDSSRQKSNVKALRAFWLDIDCGPKKAIPNPKTGRPEGYIDQATGLLALRQFCTTVGLPKPILVNSGRGIHAYWPLTRDVTREEWEPTAARLRDLCVTHGLIVDPAVFEVARVLRIPGTLNFKDDPPNPVSIITTADPIDFDEFRKLLGVKESKAMEVPERPRSNLSEKLQDNSVSRFSKIMKRSIKGDGCQQLVSSYEERAELSEVRWFDALSVAKFCVDRDTAIQKMSHGHPDYDPVKALEKTKHISGPHNCATFERNNPGGCYGCPYLGKIKNPIVLGREIAEAETEDGNYVVPEAGEADVPQDYRIPEYPFPFTRGKKGGIYIKPEKDEELPTLVYEHDLYLVKTMTDPKDGDVLVMRLHLPKEGVREFIITQKQAVGDAAELRKVLASKGVAATEKQFKSIILFVTMSLKAIQYKRKAELMRMQFGWADNDSKFIIGDREISHDGIFHSPPSSATKELADRMHPAGSYDKWQEVFNLYGRPGLEPHAFAALTAFGAPLFKFTGQSGAILNVIHPSSGTGKTTILHMCNSVWGHPRDLCAIKGDTANAKTMQLGIHNNLPFCVDEITNMTPTGLSEMSYNMSQGRGKNRMKASTNELRMNNTTWQTISLCSSNSSFYEKLGLLKNNPDGEMMRLIEYKIGYNDAIPTDIAKEMFDHQLLENYGHAGAIFIQWVINNLEEVKNTLKVVQVKIDRELKLTQRERFWSAKVAANITGGMIARRLKIIDWDMGRIYQWATNMICETRQDVEPPNVTTTAVLGDYLNRNIHNILIVNDKMDNRSNMQAIPELEPKGALYVRFEPDTKRLFVDYKHFREECIKAQINFKEVLSGLKKSGAYVRAGSKRLSKGMRINTLPVYAIEFDTSVNDFLDMEGFIPESEDAS